MNPDPLTQALLERSQPGGLPAQPTDGFWAKVGAQPPAQPPGMPGMPPPQGGPPSLPPPQGAGPGRESQPPSGTPNLAQSGPQGQPNAALLQALLGRGR